MPAGRPRQLKLSQIRVEPDIQARVRVDDQVVADYAEAVERGDKLPAVVVFADRSGTYWLADGFHRVAAYRRLGREVVPVQIQAGSRADAAWYALGANRANGVRMSNADKERAVKLALQMRPKASNASIAAHVGVSDKTVAKHRSEVCQNRSGSEIPSLNRREGRDGKTYPATTSRSSVDTCADDPPPSLDDDDPPPAVEFSPNSPAAGPSQAAAGDPPPPPKTDRVGNPIPNDRIAEAFRRDHELVELCTQVSRLKTAVLARVEMGDSLFAHLTPSQFEVDCNNLRRALDACRPFAICPYCGGEGCKACRSTGWVNELAYKAAPGEIKR